MADQAAGAGGVAMIGLDAAELSFIRRHLGSLPTMREVLDTGGCTACARPPAT